MWQRLPLSLSKWPVTSTSFLFRAFPCLEAILAGYKFCICSQENRLSYSWSLVWRWKKLCNDQCWAFSCAIVFEPPAVMGMSSLPAYCPWQLKSPWQTTWQFRPRTATEPNPMNWLDTDGITKGEALGDCWNIFADIERHLLCEANYTRKHTAIWLGLSFHLLLHDDGDDDSSLLLELTCGCLFHMCPVSAQVKYCSADLLNAVQRL